MSFWAERMLVTSYEPQEGEKHRHSQKLLQTIFWEAAGLHAQDEQEMTQFLPSGSWYLIWVTEKWNSGSLNAHEQGRRKSLSWFSCTKPKSYLLFLPSTTSWINRKAGFDTISTIYVLLHDFNCIKWNKAFVKEIYWKTWDTFWFSKEVFEGWLQDKWNTWNWAERNTRVRIMRLDTPTRTPAAVIANVTPLKLCCVTPLK